MKYIYIFTAIVNANIYIKEPQFLAFFGYIMKLHGNV